MVIEPSVVCASPIWNHAYDFRPKLHDTKFNYHSITAILKSQIQSVPIFYWTIVTGLLKSGNKKAFTSHFVSETETMRFF